MNGSEMDKYHKDLDEYEIILDFKLSVLDNNDKIFRTALEAYVYSQIDLTFTREPYLLQEIEDICSTDFDIGVPEGQPGYDSFMDAESWIKKIKEYDEEFKVLAFCVNEYFNRMNISLNTHQCIPVGANKIHKNKIIVFFKIEQLDEQ